ncbi:MAG: efflux RND transporter periplasmic adaptor subunit [Oceanicoccus sp.]
MNNLIVAVIILTTGLAGGWWLSNQLSAQSDSVQADGINNTERKPLFYRHPMNPEITSATPAKGSMGMDYIPVYAEVSSLSENPATVTINPTVVQNIGVRTAIAQQRTLSRTIRTVGRVSFNEELITRLHPKVEGWVESVRIFKTGDEIVADEILLDIYSPQLVSTQQEYLLALNNLAATANSDIQEIRHGAEDLVKSARERLRLLDVPEHQIRDLEKNRKISKALHIHSPVAGTVIEIGARKGQFVGPQTELYTIVDLNQIWVFADIYEYELPWINKNDRVSMSLESVPGRTFIGSLDYIYPYANAETPTTKVRMVFDNTDQSLRPNMFADVRIKSDGQQQSVVIPAEAIVRSGDNAQVFVVREPGKFEPRIVKLGIESSGQVAILEGISVGEEVVTSAQFLIDSESKLREATAKMLESSIQGEDNHD